MIKTHKPMKQAQNKDANKTGTKCLDAGSLGTILVLHGDITSFTMDGSKDRINQKYMMKR